MEAFFDRVLHALITYRIGIFSLFGIGFLVYLRKFALSIREWRGSVFGLEREIAKRKLFSALTGLVLTIILLVGEFLLTTIIRPQLPALSALPTPTIDPFATPTATLLPEEVQALAGQPTPTIGSDMLESTCTENVLEITSPADGEEVSGTVEIIGTVNIEGFGSYKYEYSTIGATNWVTIAAGNQLKLNENLGFWYTSSLTPGPYLLQLVPLDNTGEALSPCIIRVEVVPDE